MRTHSPARGRRVRCALWGLAFSVIGACTEVGAGPEVPAAIEFSSFPSPSVVIGDTLRNIDGAVMPIAAVVRNVAGDIIPDAAVQYVYADFTRDSALSVDATTGIVVARKAATGTARLAARVGDNLQILKSLVVTLRPDTMIRSSSTPTETFFTILPDTIPKANTTPELSVVVQHIDTTTALASAVNGWPVKFRLVYPANPSNDTTLVAFLVNDNGQPSVLDTTSSAGQAGRKVRLRAAQFPAAGVTDSVIVEVTSTYKGLPLKGSPHTIVLHVARGTVSSEPVR